VSVLGRLRYTIALVLGVGVLGLAAWAVIAGVLADPSVVGALATALSAVVAVLIARSWEKRQELEQTHREQMAPIYEELFVQFTKVTASKADAAKQQVFFKELHRKLVLYGPSSIMKAWLTWLRESEALGEIEEGDARSLLLWEQVLFAIRKDLGHDDRELNAGDLLRIYVSGVDHAVQLTLADPATAARFKR
jgi:hypothetical protein